MDAALAVKMATDAAHADLASLDSFFATTSSHSPSSNSQVPHQQEREKEEEEQESHTFLLHKHTAAHHYAKKEYKKAVQEYKHAHNENTRNAAVCANIAQCCIEIQEWENAYEWANKAIERKDKTGKIKLKAYWRKAVAGRHMLEQERKKGNTAEGGQWYEGAKSALKMVKILEPTYKGHNEELKILEALKVHQAPKPQSMAVKRDPLPPSRKIIQIQEVGSEDDWYKAERKKKEVAVDNVLPISSEQTLTHAVQLDNPTSAIVKETAAVTVQATSVTNAVGATDFSQVSNRSQQPAQIVAISQSEPPIIPDKNKATGIESAVAPGSVHMAELDSKESVLETGTVTTLKGADDASLRVNIEKESAIPSATSLPAFEQNYRSLSGEPRDRFILSISPQVVFKSGLEAAHLVSFLEALSRSILTAEETRAKLIDWRGTPRWRLVSSMISRAGKSAAEQIKANHGICIDELKAWKLVS